MMNKQKYFKSLCLFVVGLLIFFSVKSQNIKDTLKNEFTISSNYQSRLHYFGRVDSLQSSGFVPSVGFTSKSGLYINSSFIFIQNALTPFSYAGTILEAGYNFPYSKNFSGNIYYDYFLYQDKTLLQQAALTGQSGINTSYNNKIVNVNLDGDIKFSNKETDFGFTAGLDKLFIFTKIIKDAAIAVNPSAYMYSGTHNYLKNEKSSGPFGLPGNNRSSVTREKNFDILAYEFSAPVILVKGKFNIYISPAYIMPQNLISDPQMTTLPAMRKDVFYFTAGIGIKL